MSLMAVTNVNAGINARFANVQLSDVPADPEAIHEGPSPSSSIQLVVPIEESTQYVVGSQWELTLTKTTT